MLPDNPEKRNEYLMKTDTQREAFNHIKELKSMVIRAKAEANLSKYKLNSVELERLEANFDFVYSEIEGEILANPRKKFSGTDFEELNSIAMDYVFKSKPNIGHFN